VDTGLELTKVLTEEGELLFVTASTGEVVVLVVVVLVPALTETVVIIDVELSFEVEPLVELWRVVEPTSVELLTAVVVFELNDVVLAAGVVEVVVGGFLQELQQLTSMLWPVLPIMNASEHLPMLDQY
jgi:hypothetical protein